MSKSTRNILLFFLTPFVVSAALGAILHTSQAPGGPEDDGYVNNIEMLIKGIMPFDPFRPYLYVYISAFFSLIFKNGFISAKIVSAVSFGMLTYSSFLTANDIFKCKFSRWIAAALALNFYLLQHSFYASTDIMFCALFSVSVYNILSFFENPSGKNALYTAITVAAASMTRYQGLILFIAAICCVLFLQKKYTQKLKYVSVLTVTLIIFYLPQAYINNHYTNSFFYSENWRNLLFKITGSVDFDLFRKISMPELKALFAGQYQSFFWNGIKDFFTTIFYNLWLAVGVKNPLLALLLMGLFFISASAAVRYKNRQLIILLMIFMSYILMISFTVFYHPRFILPVMGIVILLAFEGWVRFEEKIKGGNYRVTSYLKYAAPLIIIAEIVSLIPGLMKIYVR